MKTLVTILSVLALVLGAVAFDAWHLDFGTVFMAAAVAAMFGLALHDGRGAVRARFR